MARTYLELNCETQSGDIYKPGIEGNFAVHHRMAGAFAAHEQSSPEMTVRLEAGPLLGLSGLIEVAAQSTGAITAPVSQPRIDRVVIDALTGAAALVPGTEAPSPAPPALPSGKLPVCQVALATSTTAITNDLITDERVLGGGGAAVAQAFPVGAAFLSFVATDPAVLLGYGTWRLQGPGRMLVGFGNAPIAGLSRAAACVVTWSDHGCNTGDSVVFSGITQTAWTALNGTRIITRIDANNFSIPVDTSGFAAAYDPADPGIYGAPGGFDAAGKTGGSPTKNISHDHPVAVELNSTSGAEPALSGDGSTAVVSAAVGAGITKDANGTVGSGGNTSQDVWNPWICVYIWKRTA